MPLFSKVGFEAERYRERKYPDTHLLLPLKVVRVELGVHLQNQSSTGHAKQAQNLNNLHLFYFRFKYGKAATAPFSCRSREQHTTVWGQNISSHFSYTDK